MIINTKTYKIATKNALQPAGDAWKTPHLSIFVTAGFGTLPAQVAGFHRADPSTALDKVYLFVGIHYIENCRTCQGKMCAKKGMKRGQLPVAGRIY